MNNDISKKIADDIYALLKAEPCQEHNKDGKKQGGGVDIKQMGLTQVNSRIFTCCDAYRKEIRPKVEKIIQSYGLELTSYN